MKILENDATIKKITDKMMLDHALVTMRKAAPMIEQRIGEAVVDAIKASPTYDSLTGGKLRAHFGLLDADSKLDSIFRYWTSYIQMTITPKGFTLGMIQYDFEDVLKSAGAFQITEKGQHLDWLRWLLVEGDRTIVRDYQIVIGNNVAFSRTGEAIMRKTTKGKWGVPPEFAGTVSRNWISDVILTLDKTIFRIIEEEVVSRW